MPIQITAQASFLVVLSTFFLMFGVLFLLFGFGVIRTGSGDKVSFLIASGRPSILTGFVGVIIGTIGLCTSTLVIPRIPLFALAVCRRGK